MQLAARHSAGDCCSACGPQCRRSRQASWSAWGQSQQPAVARYGHRRRTGPVQLEASSNGANGVAQQQEQLQAPALGLQQQQQAPPGAQQDADQPGVWTKFVAETLLPTKHGKFRLRGYRHTVDGGRTYTEPSVIISGQPEGLSDVAVRVHDACFTSEVLGSLKCDCREQLELALEHIRDAPPGMVVYLQQEGRGIGLANKIAAYALQEKGLDTVDANRALGLPDDCREYSAVRHILADLGVRSVRLMTNNPRKLAELAGLGIPVTGRIPCQVPAQKYNAGYLSSKHRRMRHLLNPALYTSDAEEEEALEGQFCYWDHEGEPSSAGIPLEAPLPLPEGLEGTAAASNTPVAPRGDAPGGTGCGSGSGATGADA